MKHSLLCLTALLSCSIIASAQTVNPAVTQGNIRQTICVAGWAAKVRPPAIYTDRIKRNLLITKGLHWSDAGKYELDHMIPISSGGNPTDPTNLALQLWVGLEGAHAKDVVEWRVHRLICAKKLTLNAAQSCFKTNWKNCP